MSTRLGRFGTGVNEAVSTRRGWRVLRRPGRLGPSLVAVVLACVVATGANALEFLAGVDAGYAFRSHADGRNHGAGASAFLDSTLPLGASTPFGVRAELFSLGFAPSDEAPENLGLLGGALSLRYDFDDTATRASATLGPLVAVVVQGNETELCSGALAGIGLRHQVAPGVALEGRVVIPVVLWGARGFVAPGEFRHPDGALVDLPLQVAFLLGVTFEPGGVAANAAGLP